MNRHDLENAEPLNAVNMSLTESTFQTGALVDEASRLAVLRSYEVLDTPPEQSLDDLAELAAHICATPAAFITLVDEHRVWLKAKVGAESTDTPRELSFCAHTILTDDLLVVADATKDPRFARNPLVTGGPGIRFYAGAPLVTPEGASLGALCVVDLAPRRLTVEQEQALRVLGRQVMTHLELRRHTLELAKRERLLTAIFDAEPEGIVLLGADGTIRRINPAGLEILEAASSRQLVGCGIVPMVGQEHRLPFQSLVERVFCGEDGRLEFRLIRLGGTERWVEFRAAPLRDEQGKITDCLGIVREVTERKRAAEALRASEASLAAAQARAHLGSWEVDLLTNERRWSAEMMHLHGRDPALGAPNFEEGLALVHPEDRPGLVKIQEGLLTMDRLINFEYRTNPALGPVRHLYAAVEVVCDDAGKPIRADGTALDITERKRSEARFRRLTESNVQGIFFWDLEGHVKDCNDAFLETVGYTRDDFEAGTVNWRAMTPSEFMEVDTLAAREIHEKGACTPYEKEYLRKDGTRVPVLIGATVFEDNPEEGLAFVLDLTERKKLERHFLRAQRMESIGTLAGGIAHDLNNALGPIILSLDILKTRFADDDSHELLDIIDTCAHRSSDMVRQVLSFARGVEGRKLDVQVKHVLEDVEQIARETFPKHIQVYNAIPHGLWTVLGDPTQLHQVLLNLCVNARDAMPEGGTLSLGAGQVTFDSHYAALEPESRPGPYVFVEIADTGVGMPPDLIERIFDPFFTTKEVGKGTGLGLSTSLAIIKSHGGFIRVESEPGKGTKFRVYLPAQTTASADPEARDAAEIARGCGETILVVDDELPVRQIIKHTLEASGYKVLLAEDGTEAVKIFAARHAEIPVVLTDMMMPLMDGTTTVQILRKIDPAVRVIASSGLPASDEIMQAAGPGFGCFLSKPYTAEALLKALRLTLDGEGTTG